MGLRTVVHAGEGTTAQEVWRSIDVLGVDRIAHGIRAIEDISLHPALQHYYLLPATLGELWREMGDARKAADFYRQALNHPCSEPERRFLSKRLDAAGKA